MKKFWIIFKHEYTRHVLRKRFIFALLSVPLWMVFAIGMGVLSVLLITDRSPVGYIDQGNLIKVTTIPQDDPGLIGAIKFIAYPDEGEARAALDAKKIQAYVVLPKDYQENLDARMVYNKAPAGIVQNQFKALIRYNLLAAEPPAVANRVINGSILVIEATREARQASNNEWIKLVMPIAAGIFLMVSVFTSSGYLMQAVVEEKENRTMELLATSASPGQIMGSKIAALICVGLTQVLVWSVFPVVALYLVVSYTSLLQGVVIDWSPLGLVFLTALPTFILIASLMATLGATITESREGQQVSTLITLPVMAPFMLSSVLLANPNGPLAVAFSLFPLTASLTLLLRLGFSSIPTWQIILSASLLILSAAGSLWLAGRVFRMGMLRYGKRMGWKDVFMALRPSRDLTGAPTRAEAAHHE